MAGIEVQDGKFAVAFEALDADGKKASFHSFYALSGEPIALRQPDPRSVERWGGRYADCPHSIVREGIYESRSISGYLVFIDKLGVRTAGVYQLANWLRRMLPTCRDRSASIPHLLTKAATEHLEAVVP